MNSQCPVSKGKYSFRVSDGKIHKSYSYSDQLPSLMTGFCEGCVYFVPSELPTILLYRLLQNIFMKLWHLCLKVEPIASPLWNPPQWHSSSHALCSFFCWGFTLHPIFYVGLRQPRCSIHSFLGLRTHFLDQFCPMFFFIINVTQDYGLFLIVRFLCSSCNLVLNKRF